MFYFEDIFLNTEVLPFYFDNVIFEGNTGISFIYLGSLISTSDNNLLDFKVHSSSFSQNTISSKPLLPLTILL
jgi:hypothetical protein